MRLVFRIGLSSIAPCAGLCAAAVALIVLPAGVNAQESALPQSTTMAETADAGSATLTSTTLAVVASPDTTATTATPTEIRQLAGNVLSIPADAASMNDISLDDQMLSRQRGGAVGMVMVAATPQLMRGNGGGSNVTLWDEIAPPSPMPIPVDAARAAQGNVANYQRK
ncbi:hypothetical protein PQR75_16265 [Paraburkholderia fungorum]|jgi:hypothetical protein|uniref:hypothetical protein n=1 Tax=Paraburkholderia fungorum TaxID=134537 RepID=UPI0038B813C0